MHDENDKNMFTIFFVAMNDDGTYGELKPISGRYLLNESAPQPLVFRGLDGLYIVNDKMFEEE